jgi:hypothetical protein
MPVTKTPLTPKLTIKILGSVPNNKHPNLSYLDLSDGGLSFCKVKTVITWTVEQTPKDISEHGKITAILIEGDGFSNAFNPAPMIGKGPIKDWIGMVRPNLQPGDEEKYTIFWVQNGNIYCYDPKIQINA